MSDNQVGTVYIRVRPDADGFRSATQAKVRQELAGYYARVPLNPDLNESEMRRERNQAQSYYDRNPLEVDVNTDFDNRLANVEDAFRRMSDRIEETRNGLDGMRRDLSDLAQRMSNMEVSVSADDIREIRDQVSGLEAVITADTSEATRDVEQWKQENSGHGIGVDVEADASLASVYLARQAMSAAMQPISVRARLHMASALGAIAQLGALGSRPQYVDIIPRVPMRAWLRLEAQLLAMSRRRVARLASNTFDRVWRTWAVGGFRSMAGLGDMDEMLHAFDRIISRLDVVGTKAAVMGTAIGSAVNVGVHALGGLVVTLADVTRAFGLAAAGPSLLLAGFAGLQTHRAIWGDFRTALDEVKEQEGVFESLPENAQRAVLAIDALNRAVNKSVQDGFWGVMTDEIERFTEVVGPRLERGMKRTAEIYGESMSGMLDLAQEWAESGQLGAAFSNANRMFEGFGGGAVEIFDAFVTVGMRASRLLPRLGHEFEQLGQSLNNYMQWASEMGMLEYWIESGVNVMAQLIRGGGAIGEMAQGLTQAFRNAGITGLPAFISGLESAAEIMQSPVWQFRMGNMFEGMVEGARDVWRGVSDINSVLYEAHDWVRRLSMSMGTAGGEFLSRIADVLGNLTFQEGMVDLFDGFTDMLVFLETGADHFGDILGSLGTITGEILRETAPGIETLLGIFSDAATALTPLIVDLIDPLTQFIDNLGHTVRHNVNNIIAPALGALIEAFLWLPPLFQNMIALGAAMSRWLPAFGAAASGALRRMQTALSGTRASTLRLTQSQARMREGFRRNASAIRGPLGTMARLNQQYERTGQLIQGTYRPMSTMRTQMQSSAREAGNLQRAASSGFRAIGSNIAHALVPIQRFDRSLDRAAQSMERLRTTGEPRVTQMVGTRSGMVAMFAPMHRELDRMEQRSRNVFRGFGTAAAAQIGAAALAVRSVLTPAFSGAAAAGRGVLTVMRGIWGLLGGLPGVALIGTISAIGHFRGKAAEARREVEGLAQALEMDDVGHLAEHISQMDGMREALATLEEAGIDAQYVLNEIALGNDLGPLTDDLRGLGSAFDHLRAYQDGLAGGMGEVIAQFAEGSDVAPEFRDTIEDLDGSYRRLYGTSMKGLGTDFIIDQLESLEGAGAAADTIDRIQERMEEGSEQAVLYGLTLQSSAREAARTGDYRQLHQALLDHGEGFSEASAEAEHYASAVQRVGEEGATAEARVQGMAQALRVLSGDYQEFDGTGYEAWDRQQQAIRTANEALEANGDLTGIAIDDTGRLATSTEAYAEGQEKLHLAHQSVNEVLEGQIALGLEAYDAAVANGEGHEEAARLAARAFDDWDDQLVGVIETMTGLDDATHGYMELFSSGSQSDIDAWVSSMGDAGELAYALYQEMEHLAQFQNFEMTMLLSMAGLTDEEIRFTYDGLDRLRMAGEEIDGVEWAAFVSANPDQAYTAMYDIQRALENFQGYQFVTEIGANADTAFGIIAEAIGMGDEYSTGEYSAILHAITEGAELDMDQLVERLVQYSEMTPEATVLTKDEATEILEQVIGKAEEEWDSETFTAWMEENGAKNIEETVGELVDVLKSLATVWAFYLESEGVEGASELLAELNEQGNLIDGAEWRPKADLDDEASAAVDEIQKALDFLDSESATPEMRADAAEFFGDEERVRELLLTLPDGEAHLEAYDNASDPVEALRGILDSLDGTSAEATLEAYDNATDKVGFVEMLVSGLDGKQAEAILEAYDAASDKTEFVEKLLEDIDGYYAEATVDADPDSAMESIEGANEAGLGFAGSVFKALLGADDEAKPTAEGALTTLGMIDGSWVANLFARDEASGTAEGAKSSVESVPKSWLSRFLASDLVSGMAGTVGGAVRGVPSIWRSLFTGSDSTSGVAGTVLGAIRGVPTLWSSLFSGRDGTSGVAAGVGGAISAVPGLWTSLFSATDGTSGPAGAAKGSVEDIPGSWSTTLSIAQQMMYVRLAVLAMRATQAIPKSWSSLLRLLGSPRYVAQAMVARRAIESVPRSWSSYIRVSSNAWSAARSAQWAINSVRGKTVTIRTRRVSSNADGGMYEGQNMVRSFAAGGFNEVHTAQIAAGATPYRVWAEPETGGEAYIPLAASKRARSTAIWEETGRRLGVTNKEGDTLVDNRTGATFNITNHYPQAEPTSRTISRSMEQLGSGAGGRW